MPINPVDTSLVIVGIVLSACATQPPIVTKLLEQKQAQASKWDGTYIGKRENTNSGAKGCRQVNGNATLRVEGGNLLARLAANGTREGIPISDDGRIYDQRGRNFVSGQIDGGLMTLTFSRGMECSYTLTLRRSDA